MDQLRGREFRRILIIKPSSFGDVIHALPVLAGLRQRYPEAHISWLVATSCAGLLESHTALDEIIRFDRKRYGRVGRDVEVTRDFLRFLGDLRRRAFDLVIDLQGLFRSAFMCAATGASVRLGFSNAREFAWMFYTHGIPAGPRDMHAVDRNWRVAPLLGFDDIPIRFDLPVQPAAAAAARAMLAEAGVPNSPYVLMGPGTRWETKIWPAEFFAKVAAHLVSRYGMPVVLIGMDSEVEVAARVQTMAGTGVVSLAGRTRLPELIGLVQGAHLCIMHDSGPMHLATALRKPMIAIYGPTSPVRTGPYGRRESVARLRLSCSPCYLKRVADCPHGHRCMRELTPDILIRQLEPFLEPAQRLVGA